MMKWQIEIKWLHELGFSGISIYNFSGDDEFQIEQKAVGTLTRKNKSKIFIEQIKMRELKTGLFSKRIFKNGR